MYWCNINCVKRLLIIYPNPFISLNMQCTLSYYYTYCSCRYFPMEKQEDFCWRAWFCHCYLGSFWIDWIPLAHFSMPCPNTGSGSPFPVVKCIQLYQQVSLSVFLTLLLFNLKLSNTWCYVPCVIRSPPNFPEVILPEDIVLGVAAALRIEINRALAILRDIAAGKDLKKFLAVCLIHSFSTNLV